MGITCCNDTQELFLDLDECKSIEEIEYVMREKAKEILIEMKEIEEYLKDSKKIPKAIKVEKIQKEYLEKRIEYIEEIRNCYVQAADLLSKKNYLNVLAVKEYMKEIIDLYTYIYDDSKKYVISMLRFKDYVGEEEKYHHKLDYDTKAMLTPTPTPTPDLVVPSVKINEDNQVRIKEVSGQSIEEKRNHLEKTQDENGIYNGIKA